MINIVMQWLGFLTRVKAHTRLHGVVKVTRYWRKP